VGGRCDLPHGLVGYLRILNLISKKQGKPC
jgi:hypothetical protein